MERELSFFGMTFGVFPLLSEGMDNPYCKDLGEVVEVVGQLLEVRKRTR